eukprot:m.131692 g.131692  ORF g.131692 m.131692 type:complete len:546 (+) comp38048_c0_seq19:683-2320(+)
MSDNQLDSTSLPVPEVLSAQLLSAQASVGALPEASTPHNAMATVNKLPTAAPTPIKPPDGQQQQQQTVTVNPAATIIPRIVQAVPGSQQILLASAVPQDQQQQRIVIGGRLNQQFVLIKPSGSTTLLPGGASLGSTLSVGGHSPVKIIASTASSIAGQTAVGSPLKTVSIGTHLPMVPLQQIVINAQQLTPEQRQMLQQQSQTLTSKFTTKVVTTAWQQQHPPALTVPRISMAQLQPHGKTFVIASTGQPLRPPVQIQPKPTVGVQQPIGVGGGAVVNLSASGISQIRNAGGFQPLCFRPGSLQAETKADIVKSSPTQIKARKKCNCSRSQCLKLYCECFANGEFCDHDCNCQNCHNTLDHEDSRTQAIKACLSRNAFAFHPKIGKSKVKDSQGGRSHVRGCNCKRSGCLKNYCECYEAKVLCTNLCHCVGCKNFEESPERKTLMHLADAAVVRKEQQHAAKTHLSSKIDSLPMQIPGASADERLPFSFLTSGVIEATCRCMLDKAKEMEDESNYVSTERAILQELGYCIRRIVTASHKARQCTS